MADPALSPTLKRMLEDINRRLAKVERGASLPWSSSRGGAFRFQDSGGGDRFVMGNVRVDQLTGEVEFAERNDYGVFLFGDDGRVLLWARQGSRGLMYPTQEIAFQHFHSAPDSFGPFFRHQGTTFATGFNFQTYLPTGDTLTLDLNVQTSVGTTGEVRIRESFSGAVTSPLAIPGGFNNSARFRWLHPSTAGLYDGRGRNPNCAFRIESRVTGGGGFIFMLPPHRASITDSAMWAEGPQPATESGNPRLI